MNKTAKFTMHKNPAEYLWLKCLSESHGFLDEIRTDSFFVSMNEMRKNSIYSSYEQLVFVCHEQNECLYEYPTKCLVDYLMKNNIGYRRKELKSKIGLERGFITWCVPANEFHSDVKLGSEDSTFMIKILHFFQREGLKPGTDIFLESVNYNRVYNKKIDNEEIDDFSLFHRMAKYIKKLFGAKS